MTKTNLVGAAMEALDLNDEVAAVEAKRKLVADMNERAEAFGAQLRSALSDGSSAIVRRGFIVSGPHVYLFDTTSADLDAIATALESKRIANRVGRGEAADATGSIRVVIFLPAWPETRRFSSVLAARRALTKTRDRAIDVVRKLLGEQPGERFDGETGYWRETR